MHNMHKGNYCIYQLLHVCVRVCACAHVTQRDARLPIDVIIFCFQALISAWLLRYFLLFCQCFEEERERKRERERGEEVYVCVCLCVGGCFTKWLSKVPDTFQCFLASWKTAEGHIFNQNLWDKKSYGASSVILWWELVGVSTKNTSSHFA